MIYLLFAVAAWLDLDQVLLLAYLLASLLSCLFTYLLVYMFVYLFVYLFACLLFATCLLTFCCSRWTWPRPGRPPCPSACCCSCSPPMTASPPQHCKISSWLWFWWSRSPTRVSPRLHLHLREGAQMFCQQEGNIGRTPPIKITFTYNPQKRS